MSLKLSQDTSGRANTKRQKRQMVTIKRHFCYCQIFVQVEIQRFIIIIIIYEPFSLALPIFKKVTMLWIDVQATKKKINLTT